MSGNDPDRFMQIHCPACGVRLTVPTMAAHRPARCPACHEIFRTPAPNEMLDETVVCWLDLDAVEDARHREDLEETDADRPPMEAARATGGEPPTHESGPADASTAPPAEGVTTRTGQPTADPRPPEPPAAAPPREPVAPADRPSPRQPPQAVGATTPNGPRLEVRQIGAFGVQFAFTAHALDSLGFRASMPMRGILSGEEDPTKLRARPLPWVDKATGHMTEPGTLETTYEIRVRPRSTTREVVAHMATIDELPPPFNQPMPYYVGHGDIGQASTINCQTASSPEGIRCEVTIPSMAYALEWLGRVNGVCGEDYAELELRTRRYESGAWLSIPTEVRHRLAVWFNFEGDERFLRYFNDADFAGKDAGLAGVIVTTRRLVWGKYHHHGSRPLHSAGVFALVPNGPFATLEHREGTTRRRLVRLRPADADGLAETLASVDVLLERESADPD